MKQSTRDVGYHTANYVQENETLHKAANRFALATASDQATIETLTNTNATHTAQIIGSLLWYGRNMDITILNVLGSLGAQQNTPTEQTEKVVQQLLDYCAKHPNAKIWYYTSDMILQIHADAAYLNKTKGCSTARGIFFMGNKLENNKPIFLN
eukprot:1858174-Ditylum_brightwellii.AAC.1